jgi:hypothetical protein
MRISQRGTSFAGLTNGSGQYTIDRWAWAESGTSTAVQTVSQDSSAPVGFVNSLKVLTTTAQASLDAGNGYKLKHSIEGFNIADLGWGTASAKTVTLSFWVRSSLTGTFGGFLRNSDVNRYYVYSYSINSADTWEYKTVTIAGDTTGTWLTTNGAGIEVWFSFGTGSNYLTTPGSWGSTRFEAPTGQVNVAGTLNATWYITGVQLEVGSVATPFERRPYGTELQLCQRYFYKTFNQNTKPANNTDYRDGIGVNPVGVAYTTSAMRSIIVFPQPMRAKPTIVYYDTNVSGSSPGIWLYYDGTNWTAVTTLTTGESSELYVSANLDKTGLTFGRTYLTSGYLTASAEL